MKPISALTALLISALVLTGCNRNMGSNTYTSSSAAGVVLEGTVVSVRQVTIKDSDKLQDNALGGVAGGAVGGVAGSTIGKGKGSTVGAVGGAVAGAVLGALIQDELSTSQGYEYVVKLDKADDAEEAEATATITRKYSSEKVQDKLKNQIKTKGTSSRLISVVQGQDVVLNPGQRVYVIYSDDRPRLAAQ